MIVRTATATCRGRAIDLEADLEAATVAAAVRGRAKRPRVTCPEPGPAHERVGLIESGMGLRTRTALAVAARSRGLRAPQDDALADARERLADLEVSGTPTREARCRLAETDRETDRLRERVAQLRGRVRTLRERGDDPADAEAELAAAVRELSEVETERTAARQRLDRAARRARRDRDERERRMQLEDRVANLRRAARAHLVERVEVEFADAVAAAPGGRDADPFDADPVTAALAVARVAALGAPVVLDCGRFADAAAAAAWLDVPVIRL